MQPLRTGKPCGTKHDAIFIPFHSRFQAKKCSRCGLESLGQLSPKSEVGGTAFAAIIGSTRRREILDSIHWIQPPRSPTSCAAKYGTAYGPSNFGIQAKPLRLSSTSNAGIRAKQTCSRFFGALEADLGGRQLGTYALMCPGAANGPAALPELPNQRPPLFLKCSNGTG